MSRKSFILPSGERDIKDPAYLDEIVSDQCASLTRVFPALAKIRDVKERISKYKRDLIYLSEVAGNPNQITYCIALALRINFGLVMPPDILETGVEVDAVLAQRIEDVINCCPPDVLDLHPVLRRQVIAR